MVTWAFIFKSEGCNPEVDKMEMMHCGNRFLIFGCDTVEQGAAVAKRIVEEEKCTLIELCGGFGLEGAKVVKAAVGDIQVGYVITEGL